MKRVLIVLDNLNTGGIATSLYNFVDHISKQFECDLLIFDEDSIDTNRLSKNVRIVKSCKALYLIGKIQSEIQKVSKTLAVLRIILFGLSKLINGEFARRLIYLFIPQLDSYDIAISYAQDDSWKSLSKGCNDFIRKKVHAKVKIAYIHCDYLNFGGGSQKQKRGFDEFDYIVCVSESCKKNFLKFFPHMEEKCFACENFTNKEDIVRKSNEIVFDSIASQEKINFVTISRLSGEKGLERAIESFYELFNEGIKNFTWCVVGDGFKYDQLNEMIQKYKLEENITLVGNKKNPFPYLNNASVFLLTSYDEAAPMVFGESAVLNVPIATTNTCSAIELVQDRKLGIVCENSQNGIYQMIKSILLKEIDLSEFEHTEYDVNKVANEQLMRLIQEIRKRLDY